LEASKDMDGAVNDFAYREVQRLGRRLFRLGLSGSFGLDEAGCREALERIQYVFWHPRMKGLTPALREALAPEAHRRKRISPPQLVELARLVDALRVRGVDTNRSQTATYRVRRSGRRQHRCIFSDNRII
jgi:hypothetical protein